MKNKIEFSILLVLYFITPTLLFWTYLQYEAGEGKLTTLIASAISIALYILSIVLLIKHLTTKEFNLTVKMIGVWSFIISIVLAVISIITTQI